MPEDAPEMEGTSEGEVRTKRRGKTRLLTLEDLDARTRARRRAEETKQSLIESFGNNLSKADLLRVNQCVLLDALIEDLQVQALQGKRIEGSTLATLVNTFSRHLEALSAKADTRKPQELTPPSARDTARAIMEILRMAQLEDAPPPEMPALPVPTPKPPKCPEEPGVKVLSETDDKTHLSNKAVVIGVPDAHGDLTRWRPIDDMGMAHVTFTDRAEAVEFAKKLPGFMPCLPSQSASMKARSARREI